MDVPGRFVDQSQVSKSLQILEDVSKIRFIDRILTSHPAPNKISYHFVRIWTLWNCSVKVLERNSLASLGFGISRREKMQREFFFVSDIQNFLT